MKQEHQLETSFCFMCIRGMVGTAPSNGRAGGACPGKKLKDEAKESIWPPRCPRREVFRVLREENAALNERVARLERLLAGLAAEAGSEENVRLADARTSSR